MSDSSATKKEKKRRHKKKGTSRKPKRSSKSKAAASDSPTKEPPAATNDAPAAKDSPRAQPLSPKKRVVRPANEFDRAHWLELDAQVALLQTELESEHAAHKVQLDRTERLRLQLAALETKIAAAPKPKPPSPKQSAPIVEPRAPSPVASPVVSRSPSPSPSPEPEPEKPAAKEIDTESVVQEARRLLTSLLRNVANASRSERNGDVFGEAARLAMLDMKNFILLAEARNDDLFAMRDGGEQMQLLTEELKNNIVQFVRLGKLRLSENAPVSTNDFQVGDAVRAIALSTKQMLAYIERAQRYWDNPSRKWAGAAAARRPKFDAELYRRKLMESAKVPGATVVDEGYVRSPRDELAAFEQPAAVPEVDVPDYESDDDLFGDLDAVVTQEVVVEESEAERSARRTELQKIIDAKKAKQNENINNDSGDHLAEKQPDEDAAGDGTANLDNFVDPELEKYYAEQKSPRGIVEVEDDEILSTGMVSPRSITRHDRTNEQVRVTVLCVTDQGDHSGMVCVVTLGKQTRTTSAAGVHAWHEVLVFDAQAESPSETLEFEVRRGVGSTSSRTSTTAIKTLRTLRRKAKEAAGTSLRKQRGTVVGPPISAGSGSLSLDDEYVPFGVPSMRRSPVRQKGRVVGELCVVVERCEPRDVIRRVCAPLPKRVDENKVVITPCRYAQTSMLEKSKSEFAKGGGVVPPGESADEDDARRDLETEYNTPLRQACKFPPLSSKVSKLLQVELAKVPQLDEGDELPADVEQIIDVEFHNSRYQTYLHFAAEARRADLLAQLLALRPPPSTDLRDSFGASPLHIAAALNDVASIDVLAQHRATLENVSPFSGYTPMHYAAQCNSADAIEALVTHGAKVDPVDDMGCTPLHHAARCGARLSVEALLKQKAFKAAEARDGSPPLLLAALHGHAELTELLDGDDVAKDNTNGDTLLWGAVVNADWETCSKLVRARGLKSIDAAQVGDMQLSCMQRVFWELDAAAAARLVPALMLAGASAKYRSTDGKTPLHFAAYYGDVQQVKRLIASGGDVDATDTALNSPLHFASTPQVAKALIDANANVNLVNNEGNSPLHAARALFGDDVAATLMQAGANSLLKNKNGNLARDMSRIGSPPAGVYFSAPRAPLVLPSKCGGLFLPKVNTK